MGNDLTSIMKQLARGYNLSQIYAGWWGEVQWDGFVIVVHRCVTVVGECITHLFGALRNVSQYFTVRGGGYHDTMAGGSAQLEYAEQQRTDKRTGKSNVVRTVCRSNTKGVIYMEIGSPRQFPYPLGESMWSSRRAQLVGRCSRKLFEGAKAYIKKNKSIPVLFIDGVDILAKEEDNRLDSHVLVLDQQSFKSRLDALIEIDDASETQAVNELMIEKYKFPTDLATSTYNIVGGRLADIHKMVSIRRRGYSVIPQEVVKATERFETADALRVEIHKTLNDKLQIQTKTNRTR
eukprot:Em0634g3a